MLRSFHTDDLAALISIEKATQSFPWSEEVFLRCIAAGSLGWVFELEEEVVAFIFILKHGQEAHILNLCVHPNFQSQGIGGFLLEESLKILNLDQIQFIYLEVRRSNEKAIGLYKKLGFSQIGERKNYYQYQEKTEDALVFAKNFVTE